jgi:ATP-dependent Lhr-like helicase
VDEIHTLVGNKRGALTLSLERLAALHRRADPAHRAFATIRPLDEAARFLGGQSGGRARAVTVVDTGYHKPMALSVITTVDDFRDMPADSIWPSVIPQVLGDILRHRSTLIFCNNRRLAERTADRLNAQIAAERSEEMPPGSTEALAPGGVSRDKGMFAIGAEGPIRAHHGSMSRERRHEMEEDLKAGRLPALVGTSSLELGIDIGAVDLVVQLQSPKSVAQGLQRVGRSGHLVGQTSRGRIYATHRDDLVEAAAVARGMLEGDVEPTRAPRAPLDVLTQQVLAMVSVEPWNGTALFGLVRGAYPYRDLTPEAYRSVLEMLSGRYAALGATHPALRARIAWDRVNDMLYPLPGTRMLALGNAGVITDRGAFDVVLADRTTRLGTLDEEFVFESRAGDAFILGSNVWRILEIEDDRIVVSDAAGVSPRMPFWRGDYPWRPYELGTRIARLRREVAERLRGSPEGGDFDSGKETDRGMGAGEASAPQHAETIGWLREEYALDERSAHNLVDYLSRQLDVAGEVASDVAVVIESFTDAVGEGRVVIHSPFGGRVNGAWALALSDALRDRLGLLPETQVNDDGILFRLPAGIGPEAVLETVRSM